jgi:hypothetical protein
MNLSGDYLEEQELEIATRRERYQVALKRYRLTSSLMVFFAKVLASVWLKTECGEASLSAQASDFYFSLPRSLAIQSFM